MPGAMLYEILVKLGDNYHSNPSEDASGSYKHGDVVVILPVGHNWSDTERSSFLIMEMYLTKDEVTELLSSEKSGEVTIRRRAKGIDLGKMKLPVADGKNLEKRKNLRRLLEGKRMSKKKVMKNK